MEVLMSRAEQVIERAMAAVAASKTLREAEAERRRKVFERIQIANQRRPSIPKGIQLPLDLH
ncbi:hypothetical protein CYG48_15910 [Neorhizobium sp. SOG26]|nr:hypothetical protein CYG48_15910 [Neorhizobium sp. SOG26]